MGGILLGKILLGIEESRRNARSSVWRFLEILYDIFRQIQSRPRQSMVQINISMPCRWWIVRR